MLPRLLRRLFLRRLHSTSTLTWSTKQLAYVIFARSVHFLSFLLSDKTPQVDDCRLEDAPKETAPNKQHYRTRGNGGERNDRPGLLSHERIAAFP